MMGCSPGDLTLAASRPTGNGSCSSLHRCARFVLAVNPPAKTKSTGPTDSSPVIKNYDTRLASCGRGWGLG